MDENQQGYQGVLGPPLNALSQGYGAIRDQVFQAYQNSPAAIKYLALPLATTAAASQLPGVETALTTITHYSGDLLSNSAVDWATGALQQFGEQFTANLQQAANTPLAPDAQWWGKASHYVNTNLAQGQLNSFEWIGQGLQPMVIAATGAVAQTTGQLAANLAIGNGLLNAAIRPIRPLIEASQRTINSAQSWMQSTWNQIQRLTGEQTVNQEQSADKGPQQAEAPTTLEQQTGVQQTEQQTLQQPPEPEAQQRPIPPEPEEEPAQSYVPEPEEAQQAALTPPEPEEEAQQTQTHAKEEERSRVATKYLNFLGQRGQDVANFEILINGQSAYKVEGGEVAKDNLTDEARDMLSKALSDPANLKGSVMIMQGDKVLFHVKDGDIKIDTLGFAKEALKIKAEGAGLTPSQALYEKASVGVTDRSIDGVQQIAANALATGASPEQVKAAILAHDPEIKDLKEEISKEHAESRVDHLIERAQKQQKQQAKGRAPVLAKGRR